MLGIIIIITKKKKNPDLNNSQGKAKFWENLGNVQLHKI